MKNSYSIKEQLENGDVTMEDLITRGRAMHSTAVGDFILKLFKRGDAVVTPASTAPVAKAGFGYSN